LVEKDELPEGKGPSYILMYQNSKCRLLFQLSDGAEAGAIADLNTQFPRLGWSGIDSEGGWYSLVGLIEYLKKERLLTKDLIDKFFKGEQDYFEWESRLVFDSMDKLIELFDIGDKAWQADFAIYAKGENTPKFAPCFLKFSLLL
jgi:hypothetical protein